MTLFVIKDGIKNVAYIKDQNDNQLFGTHYYVISYNFKSNEGYIERKGSNVWRLYTQVGQKLGQSRYHSFTTFNGCIKKLIELKGNEDIIVCDSTEIEKYNEK
tara:strand:+ start:1210 stop:1518 length:309 start_codon:yes stop_codon:yes gene_type:complete